MVVQLGPEALTLIAQDLQSSSSKIAKVSQDAAADTTIIIQNILHFDELPKWMQVDPHIRQGYRPQLDSFRDCFWSLFYPHNELVNTWSHLLPAFFYLALLLGVDYLALHSNVKISAMDNLVFEVYVAGTFVCLFFSAFYHSTSAHSEAIARFFLKIDYLGIVISICGTNISSTYFGLYGKSSLQIFYISQSVLYAVAVFRALLGPNADGPRAAVCRSTMLSALAGSGCAPILHLFVVEGRAGLQGFAGSHTILMCLCYLLGIAFYVARVPESCPTNAFDLWGASHQIFHILVAIGQFIFLLGLKEAMLMRYLQVGV